MIRSIFFATLLAQSMVLGQSSAVKVGPAFEVASIRIHQGPLHKMRELSFSGPVVTLEGYNRMLLILEAYDLKDYQLSWLSGAVSQDNVYYDIVAKAEGDSTPTKSQFHLMLQTLLAQRFHLKFHFETKEAAVYALTVGKNGPKFKQSAADASAMNHFGVHDRNPTVEVPRDSMESLAAQIQNVFMVDRPVVDRTGLNGNFDIKLEATPEFRIANDPEADNLSVFTAVQEQLGLRLSPAKAPVQDLVVEHIENPSEN